MAQGAQAPSSEKRAYSISAIFVPTFGIFEGQYHATHDDHVYRFWDDGSSTLPVIVWEGHAEGDAHPNADTSAWSSTGKFTKITAEAAANDLGMDESNLTPEMCTKHGMLRMYLIQSTP
jgi:hypothetical protein